MIYYHYCYLPLYIVCGEHLLGVRLRPANIDASSGALAELERIIKTVKEALLQMAVQRQIGAIQINHDLLRWLLVRLQENVDSHCVDLLRIIVHLLVAVFRARFSGQLQTVQCAFPANGLSASTLPASSISSGSSRNCS
jgi:Transposase DDE domain group 1